jgi:hypothetical protein
MADGLVLSDEFDHSTATLPPHAAEVMSLFGFPYGADAGSGSLWWRTSVDGSVVLFANCSDLFAWATSDVEEITAADMPLLRATFHDLWRIDEEMYLNELFAARKRRKSPMPEFFRGDNRSIAVDALFIAASGFGGV